MLGGDAADDPSVVGNDEGRRDPPPGRSRGGVMSGDGLAPEPNPSSTTGRDLIEAAARLAVHTAWWATGPVRSAGRKALHAAEAAVSDLRQDNSRPHARPGSVAGGTGEPIGSRLQTRLRPMLTRLVDAVLADVDLTEVILRNVDLDAVAAGLDIDAIVKRVDINGIVAAVDLDAAIRRVDINAIVKRVDLNEAVATVDLEAIVNRLDINGIADELDLDPLIAKVNIQAVIDRVDIDAIVDEVDPNPIIDKVDFDAALAHVDMIGIAQQIIDGVDLPGIIRDSTGSLASEAVHGVRVQGQHADDAVGQLVGRMFHRRPSVDEPAGGDATKNTKEP
jgi:hypothetical protein